MTRILFDLADIFKTSQYTAYLPDYQKKYSDKFPEWERIEFRIKELTSTQLNLSVEDNFNFTTWGCIVTLKISRSPEDFFQRIESSLQFLSDKFRTEQ